MTFAPSSTMLVKNFRSCNRRHLVNLDSGLKSGFVALEARDGDSLTPVGLGDVVSRGFGPYNLGVAVCALDQQLRLFVGSFSLNLFELTTKVTRQTIVPLVKRFVVSSCERPTFSWTYCAVDALEDPMTGTKDILKFVCEMSASYDKKLRFYYVWKAIQRGEDITSDKAKFAIDAAVASRVVS